MWIRLLPLILKYWKVLAVVIGVALVYGYGVSSQKDKTQVEELKKYRDTRERIDEATSVNRTVDDALNRLREHSSER